LILAENSEGASAALERADEALDQWNGLPKKDDLRYHTGRLPIGVTVRTRRLG
jgi:hypothetical protein